MVVDVHFVLFLSLLPSSVNCRETIHLFPHDDDEKGNGFSIALVWIQPKHKGVHK